MPDQPTPEQVVAESDALRARLNEAEETLRAILGGEVDALVVSGAEGDNILDLKGVQEPYRVMVEAMGEGAVALAMDGTVLYANRRFAEWVEVPLGQIVGRPLQGMLAEQDREGFGAMLVQGAEGVIREALTLLTAGGKQTPALFSMSPLAQDGVPAISVVITDLSEAAAAAEARSRLALIVESSDDAIVSTTLDGVVESWNRAAEELYGYSAKEAIGQSIESLTVPPERIQEVQHGREAIRRGERALLEDTMRQRKDGTQVDVSVKASPMLDDDGAVVGASINARDITGRKRVELERDRATHLLGERLKELGCLYSVSSTLADIGLSVEQCMQRVVETIPPAFQYPEVTCARISLWGRQYRSDGFKETAWRLAGAIAVAGEESGALEVFRTDGRPAGDEGPFLTEERDLVDTIARITGDYIRFHVTMSHLLQFRDLLDDSSDSVLVVDPGTARIVDVNARACASLGYGRDELLRMNVMNIDADVPNKSTWDTKIKAVKEAGAMLVEAEFRRKDGSTFPVEISVKHVSREGSDYVVAIARDITERQQAETALRESEEEFHTLAEAMPQIVWITRGDGWNIYFNRHWMDYTGLSLEQSLGHGWNKPFHPDDRQRAWDAWQNATKNLSTYSIETRLRRFDGEYRWWLVRGVPLQDAGGNVIKWFGTCTDIHDLKMAELEITHANAQLQESERRFTNMLENVTLVSIMLDREARITYCNDFLLQLTGWRREEVIGKDWWDTFMPPELNDLKDSLFAGVLVNQPWTLHYENEIVTRSGERRLIRWNNSVLHSATGEVVGTASIGEDITEQKRFEENIKYLNRVLSMLSGISSLIVRANGREELFRDACDIAVDEGRFRMAMIVIVDPSTMLPVSVTTAGKDEELQASIKAVTSSGQGMQTTLIGRVMREQKTLISNNIQNDPRLVFGKRYVEAGVTSMALLPLMLSGQAVGVVAFYASEIDFFQNDEMKLLTELAGDIAFAIDHLAKLEELNYLAFYDVLTGLANRTLFLERLEEFMLIASRCGHKLAMGLIDLERFKSMNDSLGRTVGDTLLKQVAEFLSNETGDARLLARIDADHFAFVLPKIETSSDLSRLVEKLMNAFLRHTFHLNESLFRIGIKAGVALFPDDGDNADTLYGNAEAALKNAKAGGDRFLVYAEEMTETVGDRLVMENQLRRAVDNDEFVLHYQPKVDLKSGMVTSVEALIRWNDPATGLVPPGRFIPLLEETGLIYEVGGWALRQAMSDRLRWRKAGLSPVRIAVNVSSLQLRDINFVDVIQEVLAVEAGAGEGLEIEITESMIMNNLEFNIPALQAIRALGVTIAIDDFGTGFSSLAYLSKLPVDTLKIDRSFVLAMTAEPEGLALVSTVINLAHSLKLKTVAEGVETEEQSRLLRLLGCDEMQGFLFSKAVPVDVLETRYLVPPPH